MWDGMNLIKIKDNKLFNKIDENALFYYVHSFYYIQAHEKTIVCGECQYGVNFPSVLNSNNIYATQFHPEKVKNIVYKC